MCCMLSLLIRHYITMATVQGADRVFLHDNSVLFCIVFVIIICAYICINVTITVLSLEDDKKKGKKGKQARWWFEYTENVH